MTQLSTPSVAQLRDAALAARVLRGIPVFWANQGNDWVEEVVGEALDDLEEFSAAAEKLNPSDVASVFEVLAQHERQYGNWKVRGQDKQLILAYLELILKTAPLPVDVLGTCWRFLTTKTVTPDMATTENPNFPVELRAAMVAPLFSTGVKLAARELTRWVEKYPAVAGLPHDLVVELVASQPAPEEWFHDVFPLPETVEWVAPGMRRGSDG